MKKDFVKGLSHGLGIVLMVGIVGGSYAALSSLKVVDTDPLTATSWNNLVDHSVPSGFVGSFALSSCPTGWSEYLPAQGRVIRGIDKTGSNIDPDGERNVGNIQADNYLSHLHSVNPPSTTSGGQSANHYHSVNPPSTTTSSNGVHSHSMFRVTAGGTVNRRAPAVTKMTTPRGVDSAGAHTHTLNIPAFNSANNSASHTHNIDIPAFNSANSGGTETRSKNVALLYCIKD